MKLSELNTGEKGVIVKVLGHGGFRKRIIEMGFIKGQELEVLLNAPLKDPVKYKIMGYEVSLRHNEASMIEIMSVDEARRLESDSGATAGSAGIPPIEAADDDGCQTVSRQELKNAAMRRSRTINVALVGNPNCGKTLLFNFISGAHERVGNYSGVTVDAKEGHASFEGYEFNITDLPGTYSLSAYSPEELYVRKEIIEKTPDIIINVIDSSNLEAKPLPHHTARGHEPEADMRPQYVRRVRGARRHAATRHAGESLRSAHDTHRVPFGQGSEGTLPHHHQHV